MDNATYTSETSIALATAKAQLDEAHHRLRATERHCADQATATLKAGLLMRQLGRESNYKGKAYHVARAKEESQQVLLNFALELLASAHRACADAHEAVRQAVQADIREHTQQ